MHSSLVKEHESAANPCKLIVNYLPQSLKEEQFKALFSQIGEMKSCKLVFDKKTGYSHGYGFVEFVNEKDAMKAIETYNGYQMEHKRLKVAQARPNSQETKKTNLYIRNLPVSYDELKVTELFSDYGQVVQVRILRDEKTSMSKRVGFVIMSTKSMAEKAIEHLDNSVLPDGADEPILVKFAEEDDYKSRGKRNFQKAFNYQSPTNKKHTKMRSNQRGVKNRYQPVEQQEPTSSSFTSQQESCGMSFDFLSTAQIFAAAAIAAAQSTLNADMYNARSGHIVKVVGIGNANESQLRLLFEPYGHILNIDVIKNGLSKEYAFIEFETYEQASNAAHNMNGVVYNQRPLQVRLNGS